MNGYLLLAALGVLGVLLVSTSALGYINGKPTEIALESIGAGQYLRPDAAQAFLAMRAAAAAEGVSLTVNYAFRSMAEQEQLYAAYKAGTGNLAATPGYSNHQGGIAVDLNTGGTSTPTYLWLATRAGAYGWKRTVASEPWHWEYRP